MTAPTSRFLRSLYRALPLSAFAVCLLVTSSGCSVTNYKRIEITDSFQIPLHTPSEVDRVLILPVIDNRRDKTIDIDVEKLIQDKVANKLSEKGYETRIFNDPACVRSAVPQRLALPTQDWLANLGSNDSRWVLLLELTDTRYEKAPYMTLVYIVCPLTILFNHPAITSVEMRGYLFDKHDPSLSWKKQVIASQRVNESIITMWIYSEVDRLLLKEAAEKTVNDMPARPKPPTPAS